MCTGSFIIEFDTIIADPQEFLPDEYRKTIQIPIIDDHQWDPTAEFYILLHTPEGDSGLGYPSIAKVSIIDDDSKSLSSPI